MCNLSDETIKKWGLDTLPVMLHSKNYGWDNVSEPEKKYVLIDPYLYEEKITVISLASVWRESGHSEWEYLLAAWLIYSLIDALEKGDKHADITILFNCDLLANNRCFTKEQVYKHIIPSFDIVGEDDECIYLKLRVVI